MDHREFKQYWRPARDTACRMLQTNSSFQGSKYIAKLCNIPYPFEGDWADIQLTEELKQKLLLLSGPHATTVIKIIEVKKESKS